MQVDIQTVLILGALGIAIMIVVFFSLLSFKREANRLHSTLMEERRITAEALSESTTARTRLEDVEQQLAIAYAERNQAFIERDKANADRSNAEQNAALAIQRIEDMQARMNDWEKVRVESMNAAKAATLASARELSSKLLEDHKRENEATKKQSEEAVRKTTETLFGQFKDVAERVSSLGDQVLRNGETVDTVWRALSNPAGAGYFAEIGLENTLKDFGLQLGRDFIMQYTVESEEKRLRPDAVVFLPGDALLVIDAKASKYYIELAQAQTEEDEAAATANLVKSMNTHLRDLASRQYASAVNASFRDKGHKGRPLKILSIMYLPNEGAVEKICNADTTFASKAVKQGIIVAGPTALACLIGFARVDIDLGRQIENHHEIVERSRKLLDYTLIVLEKAEKIGSGLKTANNAYDSMRVSVNGRLLSSMHKLAELGVRTGRAKGIPERIKGIDDKDDVIDAETDELENPPAERIKQIAVFDQETDGRE